MINTVKSTRSVSLDARIVERVKQLAEKDHRTFSGMLEVLLRGAIRRIDDATDAAGQMP